jgi:hypothetical protein
MTTAFELNLLERFFWDGFAGVWPPLEALCKGSCPVRVHLSVPV